MQRARTFSDFLAKLMVAESGIDPALFDWYRTNYHRAVLRYPRVAAPGRVERDANGNWHTDVVTVAEYFRRLGIDHLFDSRNPASVRTMQYASTNFLGFVGYQLGEAILVTTGHYTPESVAIDDKGGLCAYERYYYGLLDTSCWRDGRREFEYTFNGSGRTILATDVNRWQGRFTGKSGVHALDDLKTPELQDRVLWEIIQANVAQIGADLRIDAIAQMPMPRVGNVTCTLSSVIAAAHLCGAEAVSNFLRSGLAIADENGTSLLRYVEEFAGYETPFA